MLLERTLEFIHNGPQGIFIFRCHSCIAQLFNASFQGHDTPHVMNDDMNTAIAPYPNDRRLQGQRRYLIPDRPYVPFVGPRAPYVPLTARLESCRERMCPLDSSSEQWSARECPIQTRKSHSQTANIPSRKVRVQKSGSESLRLALCWSARG
jgi:hypothetical protein